MRVSEVLETDKGFVWMEVTGVRVYSCYFSPNDPFDVSESEIRALEESLKEAAGQVLIADDFNSKSLEWGEIRLRMIDNYLSDRWVIYEGDIWNLKEEMTCGAPQGLRIGPFVWNIMYNDFLRINLPANTTIFGFADDALVVCAADDVGIFELRINESLWRVKRWLDARGLEIALEKPDALLVTDRRSFRPPLRRKLLDRDCQSYSM